MKTYQMTLDENLIKKVDAVAKRLHTSRSAFTRTALAEALIRTGIARLEERHRAGYIAHPADPKEFSVWESVQEWGDK